MREIAIAALKRKLREEYVEMGDAPVRYWGTWRILVNKTLSGRWQVRIQLGEGGQCWEAKDGEREGAFEGALGRFADAARAE